AKVITKVRSQVDFCRQLQKSGSIVTWDNTVDRHARTAQNLITILNQPEFSENPEKSDLLKRLDALLSRCKDSTFQIAFVGAVKAGKSTLINAILGQNIASTSVTPETAALTKFRQSESYYVKVIFYTASEWDALWATVSKRADVFMEEYKQLDGDRHKREWVNHADYNKTLSAGEIKDELERWSSSKHPEHYFVKEIEVGLPTLKLPENVVFVDTPGLDDPVAYRSDVTSNYIARANAVFACVTAHAMTGEEQKTIYGVFNNSSSNDKIFIIGTQTDNLNSPLEDWQKQCNEWVKYMKEPCCYGSETVAREHILPAAAFVENLCREYRQNPDAVTEDEQSILLSLATKYKTLKVSDIMKGQSAIAHGFSDLQKYTYIDDILDI
ncbi:MAG: dynamin family protein, partial [Oscillospiraceae bacterium]|nr:dynamin family protein [Oscillospiraceae bacterium]